MTKRFLQQITFMCMLLMLGMMNLIIAPFTTKTWIFILDVTAAAFCFLMAFFAYRKARRVAGAIDILHQLTQIIIRHDEESQIKGQDREQPQSDHQSPCCDDSEDDYAHPV